MRLWTFQDKSTLCTINNIIYKKHMIHGNGIKDEDKQYCSKIDDIRVAPIYTFARIMDCNSLGVLTLFQAECTLDRYYHLNFHKDGGILLYELEVPENVILNAKHCSIYSTASPVTSKFKSFVRNDETREDIECVIPYIKKDWIASIKKLLFDNKIQQLRCIEVESNKSLFPAWTSNVILCDNGYTYKEDGNVLTPLSRAEMIRLSLEIGMSGAPRYYTVLEALDVCNNGTRDKIISKIGDLYTDRQYCKSTLIMNIFPNGLREE